MSHYFGRTHTLLCILHTLHFMFINTLLHVYYHFTSRLLTLFFRFTQRLLWVLSQITPGLLFSPAFTHTLLWFHSCCIGIQTFLWLLLTIYSRFIHSLLPAYSKFTLGFSHTVPMFYTYSTPYLLSLYSGFAHTLFHVLSHLNLCLPILNSISPHFFPDLHTLCHI